MQETVRVKRAGSSKRRSKDGGGVYAGVPMDPENSEMYDESEETEFRQQQTMRIKPKKMKSKPMNTNKRKGLHAIRVEWWDRITGRWTTARSVTISATGMNILLILLGIASLIYTDKLWTERDDYCSNKSTNKTYIRILLIISIVMIVKAVLLLCSLCFIWTLIGYYIDDAIHNNLQFGQWLNQYTKIRRILMCVFILNLLLFVSMLVVTEVFVYSIHCTSNRSSNDQVSQFIKDMRILVSFLVSLGGGLSVLSIVCVCFLSNHNHHWKLGNKDYSVMNQATNQHELTDRNTHDGSMPTETNNYTNNKSIAGMTDGFISVPPSNANPTVNKATTSDAVTVIAGEQDAGQTSQSNSSNSNSSSRSSISSGSSGSGGRRKSKSKSRSKSHKRKGKHETMYTLTGDIHVNTLILDTAEDQDTTEMD